MIARRLCAKYRLRRPPAADDGWARSTDSGVRRPQMANGRWAPRLAPNISPKIDVCERTPRDGPQRPHAAEAEPRRRTSARLLTNAVMRSRPSRPHPTSGRLPAGPSFPPFIVSVDGVDVVGVFVFGLLAVASLIRSCR